jgi:hypothetical protein
LSRPGTLLLIHARRLDANNEPDPERMPLIFLCAVLMGLAACAPSAPVHGSTATVPSAPEAAPRAERALSERSCRKLSHDAYVVINAHNECTADAECGMAAAACTSGFGCGVAVRASDVAQVDAEVASISERYEAGCNPCARQRVRCMKANPVCRDGRCRHAPTESSCDQLEQEAKALLQEHNGCNDDADCVFARGVAGCPQAYVCGAIVNEAHEQAFAALAAPLSNTVREQCGRCALEVASCFTATPACRDGRCSRERASP